MLLKFRCSSLINRLVVVMICPAQSSNVKCSVCTVLYAGTAHRVEQCMQNKDGVNISDKTSGSGERTGAGTGLMRQPTGTNMLGH
jgi:hypothetical protein